MQEPLSEGGGDGGDSITAIVRMMMKITVIVRMMMKMTMAMMTMIMMEMMILSVPEGKSEEESVVVHGSG